MAAGPTRGGELFDGRYRVRSLLGRGRFGRVLSVDDMVLSGPPLALKVLTPGPEDGDLAPWFRREIRILRSLQHPGIVAIHNDGRTPGGELYFTMTYVGGQTLEEVLQADAPLPVDRVVRIARQIAAALGCAHAHGVIHRDLKPQNIVVETPGKSEERIQVLDFGLARIKHRPGSSAETRLVGDDLAVGTPYYMAPEQKWGTDLDERVDLYALGVVLYRMLSGSLPFPLGVFDTRTRPDPLARDVPSELAELVQGLLNRDREARPALARVVEVLDRCASRTAASSATTVSTRGRRRRALWTMAISVLGIATGVTKLWPTDRPNSEVGLASLLTEAPVDAREVAPVPGVAAPSWPAYAVRTVGNTEPEADSATSPASTERGRATHTGAMHVGAVHAEPSPSSTPPPRPPQLPPGWAAVKEGGEDAARRPLRIRHELSGIEMVLIPPGLAPAGPTPWDPDAREHEWQGARVVARTAFYAGVHEVTREQYRRFCAATGNAMPEQHRLPVDGEDHPVAWVTRREAHSFAEWLGARLPSEAEWEYFARAGASSRFLTGEASADLEGQANVGDPKINDSIHVPFPFDDGFRSTAPVGSFRANAWRLQDVLGNVAEWCAEEPGAPLVARGGSWADGVNGCRLPARRVSNRDGRWGDVGFRCVLSTAAVR